MFESRIGEGLADGKWGQRGILPKRNLRERWLVALGRRSFRWGLAAYILGIEAEFARRGVPP
ncbi:MAG: hypothetical protein ACI9KS_002985, partial [Sulfitobacter sp.]